MSWVRRFARVRAVVVGDLVADHYVYGRTERVSREAPVLVVRHEREEVKLGGGANAAANARALGAQVTVVGAIGRDPVGVELRRLLGAAGMQAKCAVSPQTETKTRVLAGAVSTTRQQMLRIDRGAQGPFEDALRRALARSLRAAAKGADVILVSDYGAGVVGPECRAVLEELAAAGTLVCVDSRYALGAFRGATVCKPNEPELAALTGLELRTDADVAQASRAAIQRLGCQQLVVTRGKRGMSLTVAGGATQHIPVHGADEAVDVTGAGDTVLATLGLALAAGASSREAAELANVAGALVVQKAGTATVSAQELAEELRR